MDDVPVVIRTHGRAGSVKTLDIVPDAALCLSESQEPLYREHYPDADYVVHPDLPGLAAKDQWMLDNLGTYFTLDDDVTEIVNVSMPPGAGDSEVGPDEAWARIQNLVAMAKEAGDHTCSFGDWPDPRYYSEFQPFRRTGFVPGHAHGVIDGHGLWYHPDVSVGDDCWITGLNAYRHRTTFRDMRIVVAHDMFSDSDGGGLQDHRTIGAEAESTEILRRSFGDAIDTSGDGQYVDQRKFVCPW